MEYTVGTYLAFILARVSVRNIFVVPGDMNLPLLDQLLTNSSFRVIGCSNELGAGYAADGCARTHGVAVVVVSFAVGGLSVINAIAGAYSEDLCVIVISEAPNSSDFQRSSVVHNSTGIPRGKDFVREMFAQVTVRADRIDDSSTASRHINDTITTCFGKQKPVYLEICSDLTTAPVTPPFGELRGIPWPHATRDTIAQVVQWINSRDQLMIVVGSRTRWLSSTLVPLAERLRCRVAVQPGAKGCFPESHYLYAGIYWGELSIPKSCQEEVERCTGVLGVGWVGDDISTIHWTTPLGFEGTGSIPVMQLSRDLGITYFPAGPCLHSGRLELLDFLERMQKLPENWIRRRDVEHPRNYRKGPENFGGQSIQHQQEKTLWQTGGTFTSNNDNASVARRRLRDPPLPSLTRAQIFKQLQSLLGPNDDLVCDPGNSWFSSAALALVFPTTCYHVQFLYGSRGWSLGAGLGIAVANSGRNRRVIIIVENSGAQMTFQELGTFMRLQDPKVLVIIVNDQGNQMEEQLLPGKYNQVADWKYAQLTRCLGPSNIFRGKKILSEQQLAHEFRAFEQAPGVVVLECCIDPGDVSPELRRFGRLFMAPRDSGGPSHRNNGFL